MTIFIISLAALYFTVGLCLTVSTVIVLCTGLLSPEVENGVVYQRGDISVPALFCVFFFWPVVLWRVFGAKPAGDE